MFPIIIENYFICIKCTSFKIVCEFCSSGSICLLWELSEEVISIVCRGRSDTTINFLVLVLVVVGGVGEREARSRQLGARVGRREVCQFTHRKVSR